MHDPHVVAFEIRRPWPKRVNWTDRRWYWPALITVWHVEPGGHDSGEVCKHYIREQDADGTWRTQLRHGWKFHVHHWRLQVHPLQRLRRRALTRCEWCHGRSRKGDAVNHSQQWDNARGPWWRGERGLFHLDCSAVARAHRTCLCPDAVLDSELSGYAYGMCARCGHHRGWKTEPAALNRLRILAAVPAGQRDRAAYERVCEMVEAERVTTPEAS